MLVGSPARRRVIVGGVLALALQLPSYADVYKYVGHATFVAPALVVATFGAIYAALTALARFGRLRVLAGSLAATVALVVAFSVASAVLFRHETARQQQGTGSTASQAMERPVHALVDGRRLYDVKLSGGAPVSPGPAWILVNAPFTLVHVYWLMLPAWLAATAFVLRRVTRRNVEVNLGFALLAVSPSFLRLLGEGHDIPAIGCAVVLLVALTQRYCRSDRVALAIGVACGVVATARVVFTPLPLLLALLLWSRSRRFATIVAASGSVVVGAFTLAFAVGTHPYPPFHLFSRADGRQPVANIVAGLAVTLVIVLAALRGRRDTLASWFAWTAGCVAVPLAFVGFGELASSSYAFATWEGANYLVAGAIPVLAGALGALGTFGLDDAGGERAARRRRPTSATLKAP